MVKPFTELMQRIEVSIPDRVLGFFRQKVGSIADTGFQVSIPDRVLGFFRL